MLPLDRWAVDRAAQLQQAVMQAYDEYNFLAVYQKVVQFCNEELGSFYLDIIKDRQYTTQANSLPRRSCQTAMYHILEALSRWIAPIMSFTADEIWQTLPAPAGNARAESVFLATWYTELLELDAADPMGRDYWTQIRAVKDAVNKRIEEERNAGKVKGGLATEVDLYCDGALSQALTALGEELRFVLICSSARVHAAASASGEARASDLSGLSLQVAATGKTKCERCWHHRDTVGSVEKYPDLCDRCVENVDGAGEVRHFA